MKKILISAAMLMASLPFVSAQDSNRISVKPYGFVRNYLTFDSRKTYTVTGGEYNILPYDEAWNEDHTEDLNAVPQMDLQALTSRFGLNVTGPRLLGMNSGAKLEGDFGGFGTNNTVLRLRLAYLRLHEGDREIVVGQDWHPMSGSIMPDVLGMASGAPFRPHSRTPQVRGTRYWGSFGCTAALLWQLQYMNNGPKSASDPTSVASVDFAHHALWPEAFLGLNFKQGPWYLQLGVDAQVIKPRTHAVDGNGVTHKVDESVSSLSPTLYAQYVENRWSIKFRTMLAQNTSHLNQLVGYAVVGNGGDPLPTPGAVADNTWEYRPMTASISYLDIAYGRKVKANLFLGYMKNLGVGERLYDYSSAGDYYIYMKGGEEFTHLDGIYRVAPSVSYNLKAFNVGLEYELTAASYGDINTDATVDPKRQVVNHRLCVLVKYNF